MAAIEIPDDYWTIKPRGFAALAQPFRAGLVAIRGELLASTASFATVQNSDVQAAVGSVDADADVIAMNAQSVYRGVETADTQAVLHRYLGGDSLTQYAGTQQPPAELPQGPTLQPAAAPTPLVNVLPRPLDLDPQRMDVALQTLVREPPPSTFIPPPIAPGPIVVPHVDITAVEGLPGVEPPPEVTADDTVDVGNEPGFVFEPVDPNTLPITRAEFAELINALNTTIVVMV